MAVKDSAQYDAWAQGYDDYVREKDEGGKYPFAGRTVALDTLTKTIHRFDPSAEVLDLGCGTGDLEKSLTDLGHRVTGVDFSNGMLDIASKKCPEATYVQADLSSGLLPESLRGKKFKIVVSSYFLHRIPAEIRSAFLKYINFEVLDEGGMFLATDIAFKHASDLNAAKTSVGDGWESEENYPVYDDLKGEIPGLVFQRVSFCAGILAFKRFKPQDEPAEKEQKQEQEEAAQPAADPEASDKNPVEGSDSSSSQTQVHQYTTEQMAKWKRVRDIPGDTIADFGVNFIRVMSPYEKRVLDNWKLMGPRLYNLFGGTFSNRDILNFRTQAVTSYVTNTHSLPDSDSEVEMLSSLCSASFLHNRFPSEKIGVNLYGLFYFLNADLLVVFRNLKEAYGTSAQGLEDDLKNPVNTKLARILTEGLR